VIATARRFRIGLSHLLAAAMLLSVLPAPRTSHEQAALDSRAVAVVTGFSAGAVSLAADTTRHRTIERAERASDAALASAQAWTAQALLAHPARSIASISILLSSFLAATPGRAPPVFLRD
jgi:hypothetical protein